MIVGLTGGIGSGKSTVAQMFGAFDIPIYTADVEAKRIMVQDSAVRVAITDLLGEKAYTQGMLNRAYVADIVFKNKKLLAALNNIVHPAVAIHFERWYAQQSSPYIIKEVAILFEQGGEAYCDFTILVTAPMKTRLERVITRDNSTEVEIKKRMNAQWSDAKKSAYADAIIQNTDSLAYLEAQVSQIHRHILRKIRLD